MKCNLALAPTDLSPVLPTHPMPPAVALRPDQILAKGREAVRRAERSRSPETTSAAHIIHDWRQLSGE